MPKLNLTKVLVLIIAVILTVGWLLGGYLTYPHFSEVTLRTEPPYPQGPSLGAVDRTLDSSLFEKAVGSGRIREPRVVATVKESSGYYSSDELGFFLAQGLETDGGAVQANFYVLKGSEYTFYDRTPSRLEGNALVTKLTVQPYWWGAHVTIGVFWIICFYIFILGAVFGIVGPL